VPLQHLQVEEAVVELGRTGEGPLKGEIAEILFDVAPPPHPAVEVEGGEVAVSAEEPDRLSVGDRRTPRIGAALVDAGSLPEGHGPDDLAGLRVESQGDDRIRLGIRGG